MQTIPPPAPSQLARAQKQRAAGAARPARREARLALGLRVLVHVGALIPLAIIVWDAFNGGLTANPIQDITFRTGKTALILLLLSLLCTPLHTLFGLKQLLPLRRPLGLYAFFYVCVHLFIFVALDYGLDLELIKQAIVEKRYVLVGFSAFLLLAPLAITSTKGWMRRLGKNWKKLHRLVYAAAALAIVHFVWLVKADIREPLAYGAILGVLLLLRLAPIRQALPNWRRRSGKSISPARTANDLVRSDAESSLASSRSDFRKSS